MTEEEKMSAIIDFTEKGHFQPSMTQLIEQAPAITELTLKDTPPYKKFENLFKLDHLTPHDRKRP
jgi:hypothetical protein